MNPIICAIDTTDIQKAYNLAETLREDIGAIKLGLEYFVANGAEGIKTLGELDIPIFLDLKFHDIPNTVAKAIEATKDIKCFMLTVHTYGGKEMMNRAVDASMKIAEITGGERPKIIGVTVLTSLDQSDIETIGCEDVLHEQVVRLAKLAKECGLDGVVCSPFEVSLIREECGENFILVVPGIRPEGSETNDQKRIMTPSEAINRGADYLVIGRPITQADSPVNSCKDILESLENKK